MKRFVLTAVATVTLAAPAAAQDLLGIASAIDPITITTSTPPNGAEEELPGLGHKFELYGAMMDDKDPNNPTNDVVSANVTPTGPFAYAYRRLPPGIKISALDDQLNLKYYFVGARSCGGGSPRIVLFIDGNGDGTVDFSANGHVNPPLNQFCEMNKWKIEDLTDDAPRWEITGAMGVIPNYPYSPWEALETAVTTMFPNHKVLAGFLLDGESCSFHPAACGKAYYDLVTIENRTLENDQDTVRGK
jgi:hypothetical protein